MRYEQEGDLTLTECGFDEFVQLAKAMGKESIHSEQKQEKFYGDAKNFQEMVDRCYDGYNAKEIIRARDYIVDTLTAPRKGYILAEEGDDLDMASFIAGEEKCYWRRVNTDKMPKVHLLFASNCTAGHSANAFINHGGMVAGICEFLADSCDLKVSGYFANTSVYKSRGMNIFGLKDYCEPLDIPRLGAVTHPSFFRRIGFAWLEGLGDYLKKKSFSSSYGCSQTGGDRHRVCSDEDLLRFVGVDKEEIVIELPAGDLPCFRNEESTAEFTKETITKIIQSIQSDTKYSQMW